MGQIRGNEFIKTQANNERVILTRGRKQMLRATVTLGLKATVTLAVIQPGGFGPPASRDVCCYSFLSIFDRVLQRGRTTSASTSRTTLAVMATPYRIRERFGSKI